ncbi:cysteine hydrolase family protein [Streptomyces phaeochromogenes]|uniref:cysteine hydrolase family protein n=1 Tax=Streptomyces phaeochromogenes TaxID=1923 RepID=UPI00367C24CB
MESRSASRTALMVLHVQPAIAYMVDPDVVDRIAHAIEGARKAGVPVMYSNLGYRPGYPELDDESRVPLAASGQLVLGVSDREHEKVARQEGDYVFRAVRISAFHGSDLDAVLRSLDINHLVITGITTGGTVFGTMSEATDKGFGVTVLSDACADPDPELHPALLELAKQPPRRATVLTTAEWLQEVALQQ